MPRGGFSLAVEAPPAVTEGDDDEVSVVSAPAVSSELLAAAPSAAARDARWSQTRWCVSKETEFAVDSTESTDEVLGRETGQGDASALPSAQNSA